MLLFSLTFTGLPAHQHVEGAHGAKSDLLGQIVDRESPPVPEHYSLAQQGSGWAQLKLLPLQNDSVKKMSSAICLQPVLQENNLVKRV